MRLSMGARWMARISVRGRGADAKPHPVHAKNRVCLPGKCS